MTLTDTRPDHHPQQPASAAQPPPPMTRTRPTKLTAGTHQPITTQPTDPVSSEFVADNEAANDTEARVD